MIEGYRASLAPSVCIIAVHALNHLTYPSVGEILWTMNPFNVLLPSPSIYLMVGPVLVGKVLDFDVLPVSTKVLYSEQEPEHS